jgi:hypothetical protein
MRRAWSRRLWTRMSTAPRAGAAGRHRPILIRRAPQPVPTFVHLERYLTQKPAPTFDHVQQRDGRWAIVNVVGKGQRVRTVPMPAWTKVLIDRWAAGRGPRRRLRLPRAAQGQRSEQQSLSAVRSGFRWRRPKLIESVRRQIQSQGIAVSNAVARWRKTEEPRELTDQDHAWRVPLRGRSDRCSAQD